MRCGMQPKIFSVANVLQSRVLSSEAMFSASAVIGDCDGVPGQQSRCTLCKQPLRGTHSHPGQWKSELQQFLLKYSEIPRSSCVCTACDLRIRRGLHGKYKGEFGLNRTSRKKALLLCTRLWRNHKRTCSCVFPGFDTICEAANVYSVNEEEVSSPLYLCIIRPPTYTSDVLVSVQCAVVKDTVLVMTRRCL